MTSAKLISNISRRIRHSISTNCINISNQSVYYDDISVFGKITNNKKYNDLTNKKRELILFGIINKYLPTTWFDVSLRWYNLRNQLYQFLHKIGTKYYDTIKLDIKAGRCYNYDFDVIYTKNNYIKLNKKIEFKFGVNKIKDYPQFLSLSSNFNTNYGEYFYDNYLEEICKLYQLKKPNKTEYIKYVYNCSCSKIKFFNTLKELENIHSKEEKRKIVDRSIHMFLSTELKLDLVQLSNKFQETQKDKIYMLYNNDKFYYDIISTNELTVVNIDSLKKNRNNKYNTVVLSTKTNTKIHMLLRWKNHAGVLYPAWQCKLVR